MKKYLAAAILALTSAVGMAQTHIFPAEDTNNTFTGINQFAQINTSLYVGTGTYATPQLAVTAACAESGNRDVVVPSGTATGVDLTAISGCSTVWIKDNRAVTSATYQYSSPTLYVLVASGGGTCNPGTSGFLLLSGTSGTCPNSLADYGITTANAFTFPKALHVLTPTGSITFETLAASGSEVQVDSASGVNITSGEVTSAPITLTANGSNGQIFMESGSDISIYDLGSTGSIGIEASGGAAVNIIGGHGQQMNLTSVGNFLINGSDNSQIELSLAGVITVRSGSGQVLNLITSSVSLLEGNGSEICTVANGACTGLGTVTSFAAPSGSWPTWLVPTVATATTTPSLSVVSSLSLANVAAGASPTGFFNFSGATEFRVPVHTTATAITSGDLIYDSTNGNMHMNVSSTDLFVAGIPSASPPTSGHCAQFLLIGAWWELTDAGAACGSGGGSIPGGALGSLPYQSAVSTTTFIASPTTSGHTFVPAWQPSGSIIAPAALDLATYLASPPAIGGTTPASGTFTSVSSSGGYSSGGTPPSFTAGTGSAEANGEGTAPSVCVVTGVECLYYDATQHGPLLSRNGGSYLPLPQAPASTTTGDVANFNATNGGLLSDSGIASASLVTLTGTQTLTNKTLTSPTMTSPTLGAGSATSVTTSGINLNTSPIGANQAGLTSDGAGGLTLDIWGTNTSTNGYLTIESHKSNGTSGILIATLGISGNSINFNSLNAGGSVCSTAGTLGICPTVSDTTITVSSGVSFAANTCSSYAGTANTASTTSMTNLTSSMTITHTPTTDVKAVTGWGPLAGGQLYFQPRSTSGTLSDYVCNSTGSAIVTGGSVTFNVSAQ